MLNQELSKIFHEIALYLEMQNVDFKPQAYKKAAQNLETLSEDVEDVYKKGGLEALEEISGIGKGLAEKIEEYIKTGKIKEYGELKKKTPVEIAELISVEGVGPKAVRDLYKHLKIKNLKDLEKAAKTGKIRELPRFGVKSEQKILESIEFLKKSNNRFLLGDIFPRVRNIKNRLRELKSAEKVEACGSIRRQKETIGDVDFLVASDNPKEIMDFFVSLPGVVKVWGKGATKTSVRTRNGFDMDIRVVPKESFGAALQYFTGNKDHNVEVRKIAIKKGYKLNEYGLFKGKKIIAARSEEEIYEKLGMETPPPEIRLNDGEIEAALKHQLPKLIGYDDLKGDLQTQSDWTDGSNSIEELAREAEKMGHEYIAITDHTKSLAMTGGSDEKKLLRQMAEIDKIQKKFSKIKILKSAEVNIMKNGSLDIANEVLAKLDVVGAAVHSLFNLSRNEQTARIIRAMGNPHLDILFHPTGRIINRRKPYDVDIEAVIKAAKRTGTILEIDAHPWRLDLKDEHIKMSREAGVKMVIDTDAHSVPELHYLEYGIAQARRGWCAKKDIINTLPLKEFLKALKKVRK